MGHRLSLVDGVFVPAVSPTDIVQLITTSLVAGLGGSGIIGASVNWLKAEIAGEQLRTEQERTGKVAAKTTALLTEISAPSVDRGPLKLDPKLREKIEEHRRELEQYIT